jgi:hypothetical protein
MTSIKSVDQDVLPFPHQQSSNSHHLSCAVDTRWLERTVQAFLSCVTTGNVKVYLISRSNRWLRLDVNMWVSVSLGSSRPSFVWEEAY